MASEIEPTTALTFWLEKVRGLASEQSRVATRRSKEIRAPAVGANSNDLREIGSILAIHEISLNLGDTASDFQTLASSRWRILPQSHRLTGIFSACSCFSSQKI
jgi:hypothetical protein